MTGPDTGSPPSGPASLQQVADELAEVIRLANMIRGDLGDILDWRDQADACKRVEAACERAMGLLNQLSASPGVDAPGAAGPASACGCRWRRGVLIGRCALHESTGPVPMLAGAR